MIQPREFDSPAEGLAEESGSRSHAWAWVRPSLIAASALTVYLGLAIVVFGSSWRSLATQAVGHDTDPVFSIWFLRWVPFALVHGLNPLVTQYLDYPSGVNLTWNGLFPLPALLLSPATLTAGAAVAYNLMATLAVALSAWTAFLAIRRYVPAAIAALFGGLLYGFSPAMMAQSLGHPQIAIAVIPPLLLIALDRTFVRQRGHPIVNGAILGGLAAAQLYIGEELLAAEAVVAAMGLVLLAASHRDAIRSRMGAGLRAAAAGGVVFIALAAPSLLVQFFGPQRVNGAVLEPITTFVTDLSNFVLPTSLQAFAPAPAVSISERATGNLAEWDGYIGLPLLGLLIFTAIRYRHDLMLRLSAVLGLLLSMLSLGVTLHVAGMVTPIPVAVLALGLRGLRGWFPVKALVWSFLAVWAGLAVVPILHNLLPARLMLFVFLFAGFLLAAFLRDVSGWPNQRRRALGLSVAGLALLLLLPRLPFPSTELSTPPFFSRGIAAIDLPPGSVALIAPYSRGGHTDAMLWQAASGFAFTMPEGYALVPGPRASPPDSLLGAEMAAIEVSGLGPLDPSSLGQMRRDLQDWRVQSIVVGPMPHRADMVRLFVTLLGREPQNVAGVQLWQGVQ